MTHQTKAIILQTVKYGETSLVVTAFTRLYGLQTYMLNGIRTQKKGGTKAGMFQPAAILDLEVYHHLQKNMQRIKESSWGIIYQQLLYDVIKNNIAIFMVELLHKTIRQPEENADLFDFMEDALLHVDQADSATAANFPIFFSLHLADFFGFRLHPNPRMHSPLFLDLREGQFINEKPAHPQYLDAPLAAIICEFLKMRQPEECKQLQLNKPTRRSLLLGIEDYYMLHIPGFRRLKTLQVLQEVL